MRAVLIVNPNATSTTPAGRDLLAHALESQTKLTVVHTDHRGHAIEIGRDSARDGVDVLIVHGGDGTVNEVVNGILEVGGPDATAPAVGVVPGGSANVFARALGISPDPIEATNQLVDQLSDYRRRKAWRRIGLMDCGERWAVFTAGWASMATSWPPSRPSATRAARSRRRVISASRPAKCWPAPREPSLTLHMPDRDPAEGVHFAFVSNSSPWTYANARPVCDESDDHLRDRPRRFRRHQHECVGRIHGWYARCWRVGPGSTRAT